MGEGKQISKDSGSWECYILTDLRMCMFWIYIGIAIRGGLLEFTKSAIL